MNITVASGRCITPLHSRASRLDSAQQHPSDAVDSPQLAAGNRPKEIKDASISAILAATEEHQQDFE